MIDYLQRAPFVRVLLPLTAGILLSPLLPFLSSGWYIVMLFFLAFLMYLDHVRRRKSGDISIGVLFFLFFLVTGITVEKYRNQPVDLPSGDHFLATLLETPLEKPRSYKAEAEIISFLSDDSVFSGEENIIVYFSKNNRAASMKPGNRILFHRSPVLIENQGNPYEFDYKRFAALRGIHRQVYLKETEWTEAGINQTFNLSILAENKREHLLNIFKEKGITGTPFDLLSALTLGYRKSIDPEINRVFAATGSTHVLSVSGLHVGIVYLIFNVFFGFLRKRTISRIIYLLTALAVLWGFAFITGFSPPVQRSALMFSMILAGENLKRPVNIYNTLAASACIILFFNPNLVYDVGFQLSYAAMTGIVFFQPLLESLMSFSSRIARYAWGLLTVSIAAQLTTFPISCYYFNQFPVYFWLSGFIVVPLSFAFLFLGMAILVTSPLPLIPVILSKAAVFLVKFMLWSLHLIESMPGSLVKDFSFPLSALLITSGCIICLMLFIETRQKRAMMVLIILVTAGFLASSGIKIRQNLRKEIIAYKADQPLVHLIYGRKNYLLAPEKILESDFPEWQVNPVIRHFGLEKPVLVAWEKDYSDNILLKKGNYLFFDGVVLWNQKNKFQQEMVEPDIIVNSHPLKEAWRFSIKQKR